MRFHASVLLVVIAGLLAGLSVEDPALGADGPVAATAALATDQLQEDFPAICTDRDGNPWVAYVEYDHRADRLKLAKRTATGLEVVGALTEPGIIHRPSIACDGKGAIWAVWSEINPDNTWKLKARKTVGGKIQPQTVVLDDVSGSAVFSDAGTDRQGRVWVAWQSFRGALGDIYAKCYDPATDQWSDEIRVTEHPAGDWEPRLAFTAEPGATVVFDSSRGDLFNVYLARVDVGKKARITQLSSSLRHQARASVSATPDGKGLWIAWENGRVLWGKNSRGTGAGGLNSEKRVDVVYYDVATRKATPVTDPTPLLNRAGVKGAGAVKKPQPAGKNQPATVRQAQQKAAAGPVAAMNLPEIVVDGSGHVWLAVRYYRGANWKIAVIRYDAKQKAWTQPVVLANSSFSQDRRCHAALDSEGRPWLVWPSDLRTTKKALVSGVYMARLDPSAELAAVTVANAKPVSEALPPPRWGDDTPDRPREDRHYWEPNEKRYGLYWGDFHRHTDISNCRTPHDGCIVEQFRYAYDIGELDILGTSDHTDIGKPYDPYEWWCDQKLADVFFVPGFFNSFYVYEREQKWPWGHRNVIFTKRGGPIVYINRALYRSMPWAANLPADDGGAEILPQELWKILRKSGFPVSVISHTGATGMGTDWDGYEKVDSAVENLVEIYQGARVSYEGTNTPQPTVGFPKGKTPAADAHGSVKVGKDFGKFNKGVYQNALRNGYKLGAFASSDHISAHASFGGVYTESFTRQGILDALNARRTIAATDKIFMEFSCNGHLLGDVFSTVEKPTMKVSVRGTAPLRAVTIIRNEVDIRRFTPKETPDFDVTFTDEEPIVGENRYYVRVEQVDGNMGWTSPVWVTFEKK